VAKALPLEASLAGPVIYGGYNESVIRKDMEKKNQN